MVEFADSPFHDNLNTNYIPTEAEIADIRAHLAPREAELARLSAAIQELAAKRERMEEYIQAHKALMCHSRRIPQDILGEIFLECLPVDRNAVMSAWEAPLLLGRICSAWRTMAFQMMPRLWSSLHIPLGFVAEAPDYEASLTAIADWLERSKPLPLSLSICGKFFPHPDSARACLVSLCEFSTRWVSLRMLNVHHEYYSILTKMEAPALAEIKIEFTHDFEPNPNADILSSTLFRTMKTPQITIIAQDTTVLIPESPFRWEHLTHLILSSPFDGNSIRDGTLLTHDVYRLFRGCINLQVVNLWLDADTRRRIRRDAWADDEELEQLQLTSLTSCTLGMGEFMPFLHMINLLEHTRMPNLAFFCTELAGDCELNGRLLRHVATSSPNLSEMTLDVRHSSPDLRLLPNNLDPFPNLTILRFHYYRVASQDFHDGITRYSELKSLIVDCNPFPVLQKLWIAGEIWTGDKGWLAFEDLLLCQTNSGAVHLYTYTNYPPDLPNVWSHAARGLNVDIVPYHIYSSTPWDGS
ncbi:hypothetical protein R3P38DRAFT_3605046 [Favolaschia claudopus]|uniref:F-box domain-containing protein n=1 Tax=Favolaschia claudopus TaxID=2862362 RepID=A0AAW0A7M6_9AGAR